LPSEKPGRRLRGLPVYDALERRLERISEAFTKLGDEAQVLLPNQPWREIRALGNRLRHNYDEVGCDRIWEIVVDDLPSLLRDARMAAEKFESGSSVY
jgi:uncharacterized protein with HEPN domain